MKKPKLSEIRAWMAMQATRDVARAKLLYEGVPHLLELVERLGDMTNRLISSHHGDRHEGAEEDCTYPKCRAARALLKELEL